MFYTDEIQEKLREKYRDIIDKYKDKKWTELEQEIGETQVKQLAHLFQDVSIKNYPNKPFYRIMLPEYSHSILDPPRYLHEYVLNSNYCPERVSLSRAYQLIQKDLENLFEYIEPCNHNQYTYSHRTFELFLRASTEFEANCKGILKANGYPEKVKTKKGERDLNITDYAKINSITVLSSYTVSLNLWHPHPLIIRPFQEWKTGHTLTWYKDYNEVKHNRDKYFKKSNLENTLIAIAGLVCLLYAQFGIHFSNSYRPVKQYQEAPKNDALELENKVDYDFWIALEDCIFDIYPCHASLYNLSDYVLNPDQDCFYQFPFSDEQVNHILNQYNDLI